MFKIISKLIPILFFLISFYRLDYGQSGWVQQTSGTTNILISVFFINPSTGWAVGVNTILKTTNGGVNWFSQISGSIFQDVYFFDYLTGIVVCDQGLIYKTYNGGNNWYPFNSPTTASLVAVFFTDMQTGWACGGIGRIIKTTNQGENWTLLPQIYVTNNLSDIYFFNSTTGCVLAYNAPGIWFTTDGGLHFNPMATNGGNTLFFVNSLTGWYCNNNILKTTDGGYNWATQYNTGIYIGSLYFPTPDSGWCAGDQGKIFNTTNAGSNWTLQSSGISTELTSLFFVNSTTGWAVGYNGKILKTTTGGIVGFEKVSREIPKDYNLYQNYPNPFNPVTTIKFDVPANGKSRQVGTGSQTSNVKLIIFDILGREAATLVNEQLKPGSYEVTWNAPNYPSGVYFYRLETENFTQTKKLILLK